MYNNGGNIIIITGTEGFLIETNVDKCKYDLLHSIGKD